MKLKMIMSNAWDIARRGQKKYGGKVKDYFAEALRISWKLYNDEKARKGGDLVVVAPWFLKKELGHPSVVHTVLRESTLYIKKETEKAYLIKAVAKDNLLGSGEVVNEFWAPKSVCA
ncbi:hypothetical protein [Caldifermentibacillus hisashii]|uniref:hypothetical protein n=1 Tax=Caldifermentibacillus hisashii TaxID=996558 RepID=UPI001C0FD0C1|nr:hypothetical protein [Caldifermentibacillus hisashii]MBU5341323.1 hypothetical protein [Caldifermentibacillus hisashii]